MIYDCQMTFNGGKDYTPRTLYVQTAEHVTNLAIIPSKLLVLDMWLCAGLLKFYWVSTTVNFEDYGEAYFINRAPEGATTDYICSCCNAVKTLSRALIFAGCSYE